MQSDVGAWIMNIAVDIRCLMDNQITGVGEYTFELLKALLEKDNSNQYYLFYNSAKKVSVPEFNKSNAHYVKFSYPNKLLNLMMTVFKYPKLDSLINKRVKQNIDLFIFPNIGFVNCSCPYIITCHDLSYKIFPRFFTLKSQLWHKIVNPKRLFSRAKKVIAVSQNTKDDLMSIYKLSSEKVEVIHSGLSSIYKVLDKSDPGKEIVRNKYKLPNEFYLYLGTLEPRKNIETLIDAFSKIKSDKHLVIAGKPGWKFREILKKSKHNKNVHIVNYVDTEDKVYIYNMAHSFVFPSYYEGFGFPPLEAMACGLPVISSHTAALPGILKQAPIYINPYNVNDCVQAMKILDNQIVYQRSQIKSLKLVEKYSWNDTAINLIKVF